MRSKIDPELHMAADGMSVAVTGPISRWDPGEAHAVFGVVISQPAASGAGVASAIGSSGVVDRGAVKWSARAVVPAGGTPLHAGAATGTANATIAATDGPGEWYPWVVPTKLLVP